MNQFSFHKKKKLVKTIRLILNIINWIIKIWDQI